MENTTFKNVKELVEFIEGSDQKSYKKEVLLTALNTIPTRKASGERRGQLAGLTLDQMTDEQLKREIVNANSVLYKATQRGAAADTIERNQARVDAALEEKTKRAPEVEEDTVEAEKKAIADGEEIYNNQELSDEI